MKAPKQRPQGGYRLAGCVVSRRPETDVRARIWKAMRVLIRFDVAQLMVATDATRTNTQAYVAPLWNTGFLRRVQEGSGPARRMAVYQLVRNSGPLAPIVRRRSTDVYDPNTGKTYVVGGEEKVGAPDGD